MSLLTPFLKLFKWNTEDTEDLEQPFDIKKAMNENWDKLDTKAQEQEKKISDIADNIEDIQTKDTEQDKLIQKLQSNMINESTEEATSLYVEDASNVPAVLQIEGNHYQETQEGTDNLAVLNEGSITQDGITVSVENGVASFSGANTSDAVTYITVGTAYLYAGQIYYMSAERQQTSGNSGLSIKLGSLVKWFTVGQEVVFECTETGEYEVRVSFGVSTVANLGTLKYLISKTSGAEWVQGKKAIPSVEYPSPIRTVGDNINYFSEDYYSCFSVNQQAIKEIIDDEIKVTTTANAYSGIYLNTVVEAITELTNKLKNKDVTYSFEIKADTDITINYGKNGNAKTINVTNEYQRYYITYPASNDIGIYFYNTSATITTFYIRKIKLEEGTEATADSPHNMGSVKITKVNKNRFNVPTQSLSGVDLILQDDGKYKINGNSTASWRFRNGEEILLEAGDYTLSVEVESGTLNGVFGLISGSLKYETRGEIHISLTEDKKMTPYFTCSATATFDNVIAKVQLEKDTKTAWVKHEQKEYILPVQQEMLEGDYFDLLNNKEVHNWKKVILNGTENWSKSGSTTDEIFVATLNIENAIDGYGYCNYFKYWGGIKISYFSVYNNGVNIRFCMDGAEIKTIEEFKAWLQQKNTEGNPVCVYYRLATPTKLDLTEEQKEVLQQLNNLDLFKGENNIYTEQDLALLKLDYTVDTKMYINNKISSQNQQILEIAGGN